MSSHNVTARDKDLNIAFVVSTLFFAFEIISPANNKVLQSQMLIRVCTHARFGGPFRINLIYLHCQPDILKHQLLRI